MSKRAAQSSRDEKTQAKGKGKGGKGGGGIGTVIVLVFLAYVIAAGWPEINAWMLDRADRFVAWTLQLLDRTASALLGAVVDAADALTDDR